MQFFSTAHSGSGDFATFYEAISLDTAIKFSAVCGLLDVKPATLKGYLSGKNTPPKAFVRLLFHECFYGRSATDSHAHAGYMYAARLADSLRADILRMHVSLTALETENQALKHAAHQVDGFAANSPIWRA